MAINFPDSPNVNDIHTSGDMTWKWDGTTWKATITTSIPIPSQTGQAGEFLQTDGTTMTWEAVTHPTGLPSQTGQAGEYLQTDGTTATWEPITAGVSYDTETTSTGYLDIPAGTTAQRPGSPAVGNIRINTDTDSLEHYYDSNWIGFAGSTPTISSIGPTTAPAENTAISATGTNFQTGVVVKLIGLDNTVYNANSTTFISSTELSFNTPNLPVANEPYDVKVINTNGGSAILVDALDAGGVPVWTTAAGSLGSIGDGATGTHFTLVATDPDGQVVTYAETTSILTTAGLTLNSDGTITGDPTDQTVGGTSTTYNFDVDATDSTGINTTSRSFSITVEYQNFGNATGGTITTETIGGINYKIHAFLTTDTFEVGLKGICDILVVAGGGSGGSHHGGAAGAGGLLYGAGIIMAASTSCAVTIGAGGASQPWDGNGVNGGLSSITNLPGGTATANGGGQGAGYSGSCGTGGCGGTPHNGGGCPSNQSDSGGLTGFGNDGGSSSHTAPEYGTGGGGGAGGPGTNGTGNDPGNGGPGKDYSTFFGTVYGESGWFAGGGGGQEYGPTLGGSGGQGGGADGTGTSTAQPTPALANSGGGGGAHDRGNPGGAGGSGIVLIRYVV